MKNDILFINISASVLILCGALSYALFVANRHEEPQPIRVMVGANGYQPALIQVPAGKEVRLHIERVTATACQTSIEFPQLNAAYPFMLDIPINITLPPQAPGEIDFACAGGGARGRILVV